jgi:hypothetical protein
MIRFKVHATCDHDGCKAACHPTLTAQAAPASKSALDFIVLAPVDIDLPDGWTSAWSSGDRASLIKCPKHTRPR